MSNETEIEKLKARNEQLEVQLAGCLTASDGWADDGDTPPPVKGDWSWSPAFQKALDNRRKLDTARAELDRLDASATEPNAYGEAVRNITGRLRGILTIALVLLVMVGCATEAPEVGRVESEISVADCIADPERYGCEWISAEDFLDMTEGFGEAEKPPFGDAWSRQCVTCYRASANGYTPACVECCLRVVYASPSFPIVDYCAQLIDDSTQSNGHCGTAAPGIVECVEETIVWT